MARLRAQDAERRQSANPDFLEALARGLSVLQAFGPDRRQMTLAEVAREVDLPRATVRRALITLVELGHVETDGRLFRLTPGVLRLAAAYLGSNGASTILQPRCERLSLALGGPCSAAVLDGEEIVFVAYGQPTRMVSVTTMVGWRLPAFCTALGRVLLAGLEDARAGRVSWRSCVRSTATTPRRNSTRRCCVHASCRPAPMASRWWTRRRRSAFARSRFRCGATTGASSPR
jgi:IclR family pca regulon transcriptional regulator